MNNNVNDNYQHGANIQVILTSEVLNEIATLIGFDWHSIGCRFGLAVSVLENIDYDKKRAHDKAFSVLNKWIEINGQVGWKELKIILEKSEKKNIIFDIESKFGENLNILSKEKENNITKRIKFGGIFKFDLHEDISCTFVEFKRHNVDHWMPVNNKKQLDPYYLTRKKNNEMFVKVENLKYPNEKINIRFTFQDMQKNITYKDGPKDCTILGNCNHESAYYNIMIATPEPIFSNEFIKNIRKPSSLDWRKSANIFLDKVPIDQSIELIADNYMDRSFSDFSDIICICPSSGNNYILLVIEKFREMLSANKTAHGVCAIIPGYELHYHASLLKCNVENIRSCKDDDRIILFYSNFNLVVIMRIATSLDCISLESENCLNDIALFINVNSLYIEANKLVVLGIIVLPTFERKELNEELFFLFSETCREENNREQKFIKFLFLCKDDMEDKNFNRWWSLVVGYCLHKIKDESNKLAFFKKLIGLTMIIMATDDKFNIPTIHNETQKQIKTLILNYEQWNAIYRKELKKIITGGYGSGKSVVGQEIVKKCLSETSENHLTLYYICCNDFSLFEYEMKKFVDKIEKAANVTVVCDNLHVLWEKIRLKRSLKQTNISIPVLLEHLVVNSTNKVYFILEELSSDCVKEEDTIKLKSLFSSSLKESLVVFIPESVVKYRELIRNKKKQVIQKNYFNKEMLGMEVFDLKKSMRVTMCNKLLIDSSENSISESKTVCKFPNSKINKISQMNKKDLFEKKHSQIKQTLLQNSSTESNDEPTIKSKLNDDHSVAKKLSDLEKANDKKSVHNSHDSDQNYLSNTKVESTSDITGSGYYEYDIDQMSKQVSVQTNGVIPKCIMETSYSFKPGTIGHSIKGEKPMVIHFPFHDITDMHSVKILSVVLQHLFIEKQRKTVVICNNIDEVQSVAYAIDIIDYIIKFKAVTYAPYLQKNPPTFAEKVKAIEDAFDEFNILVTDSKGFSGAESESVVVVVRLDEIFLRHVLVDAMARSNSHLVILVLGYNNKEFLEQKGTIRNVINDWSENIVEKIIVNVCNKDDQLCTRTGFCLTISENCKEFVVRGSKKDFDAYKDSIKFKVNEKNIARFETMALEIQGDPESKNDYIKDRKMFIECFYEAQASNLLTDEIRLLIDNEQWTISIENEKASYEVLCESYFVNYLLGSGKRLERLDVLKSFLTPDEENLIMKCLSNVSIVHIYFPFKVSGWIPKNKIEHLWINFKSYFVSKEDFTSFYPWIGVCESLALYLHEDTNFLQEIYEHICTLNFKELIINYRNIDLHTHDEFKRFLDITEE